MNKKIIINESELKAILSEELSKISLLNTVLEYFKGVPPECFVWKRNLSRGGKYLCYVCGFLNKENKVVQLVDDKYMPLNILNFFDSLQLLRHDRDISSPLIVYGNYQSEKTNVELSAASDIFSIREFEKDIHSNQASDAKKILEIS